jgi:nucleotide-binding universal stress UspA family protein
MRHADTAANGPEEAVMFNKIVVPLDGSALAERALPIARALARQAQGELLLVRVPELVHMIVPGNGGHALLYPEQSLGYSEKQANEYLDHMREALAAQGVLIQTAVPHGDPATALVEVAREIEANLIVMSSHGYSGLTRWLLGSVAEKVLHAAPCPVLVLRTEAPPTRMALALDGSALSEEALEPALSVAQALGVPVTLVRAVPTLDADELRRLNELEPGIGWRLEKELTDEAAEYLDNTILRFARPGLIMDKAVRFEPAAEGILDYAEAHAVDLIAMATHGRTGLRRWVYGSVTDKVLRAGHFSMLIVRPPAVTASEAAVGAHEARLPRAYTAMPTHVIP